MNSKMTFHDLENLIDSNVEDLHEHQVIFKNKADGLQQHYCTSVNTDEKVVDRLNAYHYLNHQVELEIGTANAFINEMEKRVSHLEKSSPPYLEDDSMIADRAKLYRLAEYINAYIHNCKEEVKLTKVDSKRISKENGQDTDNESLAKMMMKLLYSLETIELSLEKMKSHIHCLNWKNKIFEESLNLKRK